MIELSSNGLLQRNGILTFGQILLTARFSAPESEKSRNFENLRIFKTRKRLILFECSHFYLKIGNCNYRSLTQGTDILLSTATWSSRMSLTTKKKTRNKHLKTGSISKKVFVTVNVKNGNSATVKKNEKDNMALPSIHRRNTISAYQNKQQRGMGYKRRQSMEMHSMWMMGILDHTNQKRELSKKSVSILILSFSIKVAEQRIMSKNDHNNFGST